MGYFPNGTAGCEYETEYCDKCIHQGPDDGPGCSVMLAHMIYNYDHCNDDKSILHILIPMDEWHDNKRCSMFVADHPPEAKQEIKAQKQSAEYWKAIAEKRAAEIARLRAAHD